MAAVDRLREYFPADRTALVLFDALSGYLHPDDDAKREHLESRGILENMQRLLRGARDVGMTTMYPVGRHAADGSDTVLRLTDSDMDLKPRGGDAPAIKPRFYAGQPEAEVAAELAPAEGDVVIPKHRWNSFYQTDLELHLRVRGIDTILLAGGSTDVGIASTAYAARDMDLGLCVIEDCCYSMRGNNHEFFMERVLPRMGRVMRVDDAVALMRPGNTAT